VSPLSSPSLFLNPTTNSNSNNYPSLGSSNSPFLGSSNSPFWASSNSPFLGSSNFPFLGFWHQPILSFTAFSHPLSTTSRQDFHPFRRLSLGNYISRFPPLDDVPFWVSQSFPTKPTKIPIGHAVEIRGCSFKRHADDSHLPLKADLCWSRDPISPGCHTALDPPLSHVMWLGFHGEEYQ
jgi:hypothetical protein